MDRQRGNRLVGASRRVQALVPETDSMAGSLERGIRAHVIKVGSCFYI